LKNSNASRAVDASSRLQDVLADRGIDLEGWSLDAAYSVSDHGRTIVGQGGTSGKREAWIATIPEDRRMRVLPVEERRFRVEGLFELPLTADARDLRIPGVCTGR
jgi:hypothetical protein